MPEPVFVLSQAKGCGVGCQSSSRSAPGAGLHPMTIPKNLEAPVLGSSWLHYPWTSRLGSSSLDTVAEPVIGRVFSLQGSRRGRARLGRIALDRRRRTLAQR